MTMTSVRGDLKGAEPAARFGTRAHTHCRGAGPAWAVMRSRLRLLLMSKAAAIQYVVRGRDVDDGDTSNQVV